MNRTEIAALARSYGIPVKGTNAQLLEAVRQAEIAARRVRKGMKVYAKGNKVEVFVAAAAEAGYSVAVKKNRQSGGTVAYAVRGEERVTAAWTKTGAWDRDATRATITGERGRKIRNLAEAVRALA
jgi:formate-dependent phosphoribosylglycinamide formyltransferase (GAR transformylase)